MRLSVTCCSTTWHSTTNAKGLRSFWYCLQLLVTHAKFGRMYRIPSPIKWALKRAWWNCLRLLFVEWVTWVSVPCVNLLLTSRLPLKWKRNKVTVPFHQPRNEALSDVLLRVDFTLAWSFWNEVKQTKRKFHVLFNFNYLYSLGNSTATALKEFSISYSCLCLRMPFKVVKCQGLPLHRTGNTQLV